ncbi:caspase family protein [Streptomyces sp. NPDC054787]
MELSDPAASRAVLIGVHTYRALAALPAVENNLRGLSRLFMDESVWGLTEENCTVLPQPGSAAEVLDTIEVASRQATDTLVVYFAGHGLIDPYSDELYLALTDSQAEGRLDRSLRFEDLRRVLIGRSVRCPRRVLILDCCWSGRALAGGMAGGQDVAKRVRVRDACVLTATDGTQQAWAPIGEPYTAFTGELVRVLSEGVDVDSPLLDMEILYQALLLGLETKRRPLPQQRSMNTSGQICLARNRKWLQCATLSESNREYRQVSADIGQVASLRRIVAARAVFASITVLSLAIALWIYAFLFDLLSEESLVALSPAWFVPLTVGCTGLISLQVSNNWLRWQEGHQRLSGEGKRLPWIQMPLLTAIATALLSAGLMWFFFDFFWRSL